MLINFASSGTPLRINRTHAWKLFVCVNALRLFIPISSAMWAASFAPTRNTTSVPALPNTASRSVSGSWEMCWFAATRLKRHLRLSERIEAKLSVAKFWNSST